MPSCPLKPIAKTLRHSNRIIKLELLKDKLRPTPIVVSQLRHSLTSDKAPSPPTEKNDASHRQSHSDRSAQYICEQVGNTISGDNKVAKDGMLIIKPQVKTECNENQGIQLNARLEDWNKGKNKKEHSPNPEKQKNP